MGYTPSVGNGADESEEENAMARVKHECCGKPMQRMKGLKKYTDPRCQRGRAVRHAPDYCACEYEMLWDCAWCRKQTVDGRVAPYLLMEFFSL